MGETEAPGVWGDWGYNLNRKHFSVLVRRSFVFTKKLSKDTSINQTIQGYCPTFLLMIVLFV